MAGLLGSLVGLGGGFILVPVLRLAFGIAPAHAAADSLVLVVANSLSGSIAFLRQKRVDVTVGLVAAIFGIPASFLGSAAVRLVSAQFFDIVLGAILAFFAINTIRNLNRKDNERAESVTGRQRVLVDRYGEEFRYRVKLPAVAAIGALVGFASSFFGIGGGIIFVPTMIMLSDMPAHLITATSTFAILLTSPGGVIAHQLGGDIDWNYALPLGFGGLIGGQLGPPIARRLSSPQLLVVLAATLILAAALLVLRHLVPQLGKS